MSVKFDSKVNKRSNNSLNRPRKVGMIFDFGMIIIERVEGWDGGLRIGCNRPSCALGQFFSRPENSTHPRYPRRTFGSFLIECVCILSQSFEQLHLPFCLNPLSLFCPSAFAPYFPQVFCILCIFLDFTTVSAHYSDFCILSQVIDPMCLLPVKVHCHVGQTNKQALPPRHFSDDQNTWVENCWEKRLQTERACWPGAGSTAGWVTSITKRASFKLANLHINHSDYLYHQHHDEQHDDHQVEHRMRNFVDHHDHHTRLQCDGDDRHDRHHVHHHLVKSQHNLKTC